MDQPRPLLGSLAAYAAKRVMEGFAPGYVYWEQSDERWDSGWRVFVGDEAQADADQPENFQINRLDTLVEAHPRLEPLFTEGTNGEFEWDAESHGFRRIR